MLKKIIALVFLVAFTLQAFSRQVIIVDFYANKVFFEKKCENRSRPVMHCGGKCQLIKKLKQEENKDQQNPDRKTDGKGETFYSSLLFPVSTKSLIRGIVIFQS